MTTERIDIVVREDGSRVVRRNLDDIGGSADRTASAVETMKRSLGSIAGVIASMGIGYGLSLLIKYSDTWANLEGRLKLVTTSSAQLVRVQTQLFDVAQRTRSTYEGTADLYARIARSTQELNASDAQRIKVTEAINKAIVISGSSATSASAALVQLGQGFASGTLRGEELNSVLEQTPRLAQAIAEGMGKTVGQLRAMGAAGQLTSEAVFKALEGQSAAIAAEFSQMPVTIAQSFTVLQNELLKFVGTAANTNGSAKGLVDTIMLVARNIDVLVAAIGGFVVMKVAEVLVAMTVATYNKITATMAHIAAVNAERAATIAAAEASLAQAAAQGAVATATMAAIVIAREEMIARLGQANGNIRAAQSAIAAAEAAGAQSFALAILRAATLELAAAEVARTVALAQLAILGAQTVRVSAQIAAATAAETAATLALTAARGAATGAAGAAAGALAMLGGPLGIILTVLGLGATAWMLWGSKAKEAETSVAQTLEEKTGEILGNLDKQIQKLRERNLVAAADPALAKGNSAVDDQKRALIGKMNLVATGGEGFQNLNQSAKTALLATLGSQYNDLTVRATSLNTEQEKLNKNLRGDKLKEFLKEYATKGEGKAAEIKKWKEALGDLFSPEVEKRLNEKFEEKKGSTQPYKAGLQALEQKQKLEKEIMQGSLDNAESLRRQELMSESTFVYKKLDFQLEEIANLKEYTQAQLDSSTGKDSLVARARYTGELEVLEQRRKNVIQSTENQISEILFNSSRGEQQRDADMLASVYVQTQSVRDKIANYEMLPAAITAVAVADQQAQLAALQSMDADKSKLDAVRARITALKELQKWQGKSATQDLLGADAKKLGAEWRTLGTIISNSLTSAFGNVGKSVAGVVNAMTQYKAVQADLALESKDRLKAVAGDATATAAEEVRAAKESELARVGAYANIMGAAKNFFGEHTAGYKVLGAAEKAYRVWEMALALESFAVKTGLLGAWLGIDTTTKVVATGTDTAYTAGSVVNSGIRAAADGVAAIAKALSSLPFPFNIAAGAATAAALIAAGVAVFGGGGGGGGGTTAAEMQKQQGTGSVFGDSGAKSNSVGNAIEMLKENSSSLLPLTEGMLASLKNIESSMHGLANIVLRTTGTTDGTNMGIKTGEVGRGFLGGTVGNIINSPVGWLVSPVLKLINNLWGKTTQNIVDSGLSLKGSVADLQNGNGVSQYASVDKTESSWFGLKKSTSNSVQTQGVSDEIAQQFGLIFTSLENTLKLAAPELGSTAQQVGDAIAGISLEAKMSLKNLKGQELTDAINAFISKAMDDVAQTALPGLDKFRQVGEGYAETVMRVASGAEQARTVLGSLGIAAISYTDIVNKQGDVATEMIRQSLLASDKLSGGVKDLLRTFTGGSAELVKAYQDLTQAQQALNNSGLNGNNLSRGMIQGAGGLSELKSGASDYFKNFFTEAEQRAGGLKNLRIEFDNLAVVMPSTKEEFKALVTRLDDGTEAGGKLVGKLLTLSGTFADLTDDTDALKTAADALKTAAELLSKKNDLQIRILELTGQKVAALAMKRRLELDAMDESLRAYQQHIYSLEDLATAHDAVQVAYDREKTSVEQLRDKYKELGKSLHEAVDALMLGDKSILSPQDKYAEAKNQFEQTYALAKSGDPDALGKMQSVSDNFLSASKDYYASSQGYTDDFEFVRKALESSANSADAQASIAQQTLNNMQRMVDGILDLNEGFTSLADAIRAWASAQKASVMSGAAIGLNGAGGAAGSDPMQAIKDYSALYGQDAYILNSGNDYAAKMSPNVRGAFDGQMDYWANVQAQYDAGMHPTATGGVSQTISAANKSSVESLYGSILGRSSDAAGLSYWSAKLEQGTATLDQIQTAIMGSEEYQKLHPIVARAMGGYTPAGLTWVGEEGPELVNMARPSMVYTAEQSAAMTNGGGKTDTSKLEELIATLVSETQASVTQRGAVAMATLERLEKLAEAMDGVKREQAKEKA